MFVCVVFGNLNVCCFVLSLIYGVGCSVVCVYLCVFVCECFCRLNVCVCLVRDVVCDVVWFVFLRVLSGFIFCIKCVCALCL